MRQTRFVIRKDASWTYTAQGYLKVRAYATRTGVFKYRENGKTILEGRLPEYVNDPESLETLKNVPLTNDHPPVMLTVDNTKTYQVGYTGDRVEIEEGNLIGIDLIITDKATIIQVISGRKVELSCGYTCVIVWIEGEINGEKYYCIQTEIIYNHVAVVEAGRAGHKVKIQLDSNNLDSSLNSNEAIRFDNKSENSRVFRCDNDFDISEIPQEELKTVKITIDGKELDVADAVAQDILTAINNRDSKINESKDLKSQLDSINGELVMVKADLQKAQKVDHSLIAKEHNKLVHNVAKFAKDSNVDEMMDMEAKELKLMALKAFNPDYNYDAEDDKFIESAYKYIENKAPVQTQNTDSKTPGFKSVVDAANASQIQTQDRKDSVSKRDAMIEKLKNKYKGEQK